MRAAGPLRVALGGLALVTVGAATAPLHAYSGVGVTAVERALGQVPSSADEVEQKLTELEQKRNAGDASAETAYRTAILTLNRPKGTDLEKPRRELADAVVADPGYQDALQLWLDLLPTENELKAMEGRLRQAMSPAGATAASHWALANVLHALARSAEAGAAAQAAETADPAYKARARWLEAQLSAEAKDDKAATRHFEEALEALDPAAAELIWQSCLLVASPEEIQNHGRSVASDDRDYLRNFWKRRDALPLSEENERLGEHLRRVARARLDFRLESNGRAYLTMHDAFKRLSPDLPFYGSDVVFDYQSKMPVWLDHRGLVFVRHGEPDRVARSTEDVRAETWLYVRNTSKPLMFHFVDRRGIGEFVLTLNLAQARVNGALEDDPRQIVNNAQDIRDLYQTRSAFHSIFQRVAGTRSRYELEELMEQEAALFAGFLREAWYDDTNNLIDKDQILPFVAQSTNYRNSNGLVDTYVYYAIPEKELKDPGPLFEFDATLAIYSANWSERLGQARGHFRYERAPGAKPGKKDLLIGTMVVRDLPADRYRYAFQVTEKKTGRIGVSKGELVADYYDPAWVDLSELMVVDASPPTARTAIFERGAVKLLPNPTRILSKERPAKVYYEIYGLQPGEDGQVHYRVEKRLLLIQGIPGIMEQILGLGVNVASIFFPYQVFLARIGMFGLDIASNDPKRGLEVNTVQREEAPSEVVQDFIEIDTRTRPEGIYQAYVTIRDDVSGAVTTRSIRFLLRD